MPLLRLAAVLVLLALPATAQEVQAPDYAVWEREAQTVRQAVDDTVIGDERLSQLRADVVKWRNTFTAAQGVNADRIETVRGQIEALGPAPAEGETEDPAIAARRAELAGTLASLQAPRIAAAEAATEADGLIRSIDRLVRERQADKLLRLSPSPANPVNWPAAVSLVRWMGAWIYDETIWRFTRPINLETLRNNAPLVAVLVLVAGVLLTRGGHWMGRLTQWLLARTQMRGRGLISELVSLGQVVLPFLGALMLVTALEKTGMFGPILLALFGALPGLLLVVLAGWWLGARVFGAGAGALALPDEARGEGRFHALTMGLALALYGLLQEWIAPRAQDYLGGAGTIAADKAQEVALRADAALAVLSVPLQVFAALALFRMGQLLRRRAVAATRAGEDAEFRLKLMAWLGNATIVIAVVAPALGLIGYVSAADALIWPAILTLAVLAVVGLLQGFVAELYGVLTRREDRLAEDLVPVVAGFVLILLALPVLALIWGARPEDLVELWTRAKAGVSLGGVRISPMVFVTFVVVFGIGFTITRLLQGGLRSSILPKTRLDKGGQNAIVSGVGYLGIFLAAILAISSAGIDLSSLAIVAGALSVGIGFGLQNIVSNFVSGIILLIERPISEGDWIEVGGQMGTVRAISVRSTRIETFDRTEVIVPNADLVSGQVTNWTRGNLTGRVIVPVGVAYGTDTRRVEKILTEIAENNPLVMMAPPPRVLFTGFGADSLNFEIRAILSDVNFGVSVKSDMNHEIAARFAAEGIEIPFAQRDIWLRNPDALRAAASGPAGQAKPDPAPENQPG
ncbi:DUF3772 domain-containing protein [Pontitalea aquivivens]|uniref:DUF3772 domain-containing protein n=1 Tax=Pontitalea aquivivens TaxID=3388663 RepID=UPI003970F607